PKTTPQMLQPDSGFRFSLDGSSPFPRQDLGPPPCRDWGIKPIYIGSAIFDQAIHPCKVGPHQPCSVAFRGREIHSEARFDPLPFNPDSLELVRTSGGRVPDGKRP
ncbi:hypothetical protein ARMGADRAFT_872275, partial [Armillaria gallica]